MKPGKSTLLLSALALLVIASIQSCKHEPIIIPNSSDATANNNNGGTPPPPFTHTPIYGSSGDTLKDSVCFNEEILPMILSNCAMSACHDGKSGIDGGAFTDYSQILKIVTPGNP